VETHVPFQPDALVEALGDPSRRAILTMLCERPASVTALASALPVSRPAVSQHLRVLKGVGLVQGHAEGTRRIYTVQPDALAAIRAYFDDFWQQSLMAFRLAAESSHDTTRREQERP
jgi:DNA-binding transcriptional ArsR family regulator